MRSLSTVQALLAPIVLSSSAVITALICIAHPAVADTRIRGEFEYNIDEQTLSEWAIGPIFSLTDSTELEIPIGQDDGDWTATLELIYEVELEDNIEIEFSTGLEVVENEPTQGFGLVEIEIELTTDFESSEDDSEQGFD
ncbi:MAG: hypothetical protein AAFQ74_07070 [Cyanobacteria bacterium J06623_4]